MSITAPSRSFGQSGDNRRQVDGVMLIQNRSRLGLLALALQELLTFTVIPIGSHG